VTDVPIFEHICNIVEVEAVNDNDEAVNENDEAVNDNDEAVNDNDEDHENKRWQE